MNFFKIKNEDTKNLHLLVSVLLIIPVAFVYGLFPKTLLQYLFDIKIETNNLANIFRAVMGLYLAMSAMWVAGILKPALWVTATWTNIIFMGGLACGRLLSFAIDGIPSIYFVVGFVLELVLAIWGLRNLQIANSKKGGN